MTMTERKVIKAKVGLLELAKQLGSVTQACRVMGYSRDSFYRFRDLYERGGDLALAEISLRLRNLLRPDDVVARLGGDEFILILRGVSDEEQVQAVRLKIDHALQLPLTTLQGLPAGEIVTVGASVGQVLYPRDALDPQSLLKQADQDMYRNKAPSVR